jgi:Putative zincin peptidase
MDRTTRLQDRCNPQPSGYHSFCQIIPFSQKQSDAFLSGLQYCILYIIDFQHVFTVYKGSLSFGDAFKWFSWGCLIPFLLVPLHEWLHGIAYKACGAKAVSYDVNWKQFYFMAIADKFVATRKSFLIVALTPFTFITIALLIPALLPSTPGIDIMLITATFVHGSMCAGDFGLLSYFETNRNKEVITYDDRKEGLSYFFVRDKA